MSRGMKATREEPGMRLELIAKGYDWGQFGSGPVVDVGGAYGVVSIALAREHPDLNLIIQDMPREVEGGRAELPSDLHGRIAFMEHDFFKPNPVKDAKAYFMRMILHDWPDKAAISILKGIVSAMGPKSKLVIIEAILPEPGTVPVYQETKLREMDMAMMTMNGMERCMEQWRELFAKADGRLRIANVVRPEGSYHAVTEVVLA